MGYKRKPNYLTLSFYFTLIGNGTVLRLQLDTHTALPLLAWSVNSHFQVFLRSERKEPANCSFTAALTGGKLDSPVFLLYERRKTGTCSFTAAPISGKLHFPVFLLCERRKAGNCGFTAALIGGKVDFPVFLRSERRKTGNCRHATGTFWLKSFDPISYPFFPSFACWWVMGRDLVPQNEGCACVNNSWVK